MGAFDFYFAQNKIEKIKADEERWTKKLLAAGRRLEALRARRGRIEKRLQKEDAKLLAPPVEPESDATSRIVGEATHLLTVLDHLGRDDDPVQLPSEAVKVIERIRAALKEPRA